MVTDNDYRTVFNARKRVLRPDGTYEYVDDPNVNQMGPSTGPVATIARNLYDGSNTQQAVNNVSQNSALADRYSNQGNTAASIGANLRAAGSALTVPFAATADVIGGTGKAIAGGIGAVGQGVYDAGQRFVSGLSGVDPNAPTPVASPTNAEMNAYRESQPKAAPRISVRDALKNAPEIPQTNQDAKPSDRPDVRSIAGGISSISLPQNVQGVPPLPNPNSQSSLVATPTQTNITTGQPSIVQPVQNPAVGAFDSRGNRLQVGNEQVLNGTVSPLNPNLRTGEPGEVLQSRPRSNSGGGFSVVDAYRPDSQFRPVSTDMEFSQIVANKNFNNNLLKQQQLQAQVGNNDSQNEIARFNALTQRRSIEKRDEAAPYDLEYKKAIARRANTEADLAETNSSTRQDSLQQRKNELLTKQADFLSREREKAQSAAEKNLKTIPSSDEILRSKTDSELKAYGLERPVSPPEIPADIRDQVERLLEKKQPLAVIKQKFRDRYHKDPDLYLKGLKDSN